jgi:hypothetical protein
MVKQKAQTQSGVGTLQLIRRFSTVHDKLCDRRLESPAAEDLQLGMDISQLWSRPSDGFPTRKADWERVIMVEISCQAFL